MDGQTIYVVTVGEYSYYRIIGVYDDKALAEMSAAAVGGRVEEFSLNERRSILEAGLRPFKIWFADNGDIRHVDSGESAAVQYGRISWPDSEIPRVFNAAGEGVVVELLAHDQDHAIKSASEIRAQHLVAAG